MALILSIETATKVCSVALHENGVLLSLNELHQDNVHSQKGIFLIDNLFIQSGLDKKNLEAVAVSAGPGSYTGLRIGVSMAKGFAYGYDIPLIGVDTLSALAQAALPFCEASDYVIPMMDARRMEVYAKVVGGLGNTLVDSQPFVLEQNPFVEFLEKSKVLFIGDGVEKSMEILSHPNSVFITTTNSSSNVGVIAFQKFLVKDFENMAYFEPNYVKEFRVLQSKKNPLLI